MLIAIEGIDGSGKGTQSALLAKRLEEEGHRVLLITFPQYEKTLFGREIGRYLDGEFGSLEQVHPKFSALLYALDRLQAVKSIRAALQDGYYVICDRFTGSNIAHQSARVSVAERQALMNWIRQVELEILEIPEPDLVIFLDVDVNNSQRLVSKKSGRSYTQKTYDLHEASSDHLERALENFRIIAKDQEWARIICTDSSGRLRPESEISDEVFEKVSRV